MMPDCPDEPDHGNDEEEYAAGGDAADDGKTSHYSGHLAWQMIDSQILSYYCDK